MNRFESIRALKGIGDKKEALFHKLRIFNVEDLLLFYPRDYEERIYIKELTQADVGRKVVVQGRILGPATVKKIRSNLNLTTFSCQGEGQRFRVTYFNVPFVKNALKSGQDYFFFGKLQWAFGSFSLENPEYGTGLEEVAPRELAAIYPLTKGLHQKDLRKIMASVLEQVHRLDDPIPSVLLERYGLETRSNALNSLHQPETVEMLQEGRKRLVVDELLEVLAGFARIKENNTTSLSLRWDDTVQEKVRILEERLPFLLTEGQKKVLNDLRQDIVKGVRLNRLVQGDVGSGKTVVAAMLQYVFYLNGYQSVLMAPTELLATQHEKTFRRFLEPLGVNVLLVKGGMSKKQKEECTRAIEQHQAHVIVGTHALIQPELSFANLGLVIADEQHRFGVEQRKKLTDKGERPHSVVMSATPIPRTIAHVLYGDLEVSQITTMPLGRQKVRTHLVRKNRLGKVYDFIRKEVEQGRQAFVVAPEIQESESDLFSLEELYETVGKGTFRTLRTGMVHGKLKGENKEKIMAAFAAGKLDVLFSTTVVEVGIDVPNATVILILDADRFGLATLHQLRGRVGRGTLESWCILASDSNQGKTLERLQILVDSQDGFVIANQDFELRGPGDYFGFKQHGLPNFALTDLKKDQEAVDLAKALLQDLKDWPDPKPMEQILASFQTKVDVLD